MDARTLHGRDTAGRFGETGWALLPGYVDAKTLTTLRSEAAELAQSTGLHDACQYYVDRFADGQTRLARVEGIADVMSGVKDSGLAARMQSDARDLLGGNVVAFKDKLNIRYPGSAGYAPHQDAARWSGFGDAFVSFGLFLTRSDANRGGFRFVEYDLDRGLSPTQTGDFDTADFCAQVSCDVTADGGDALAIDGRAPHCTTDNRSDDVVMHLLFTYARSDDPGLRASYYAAQQDAFDQVRDGNVFTFAAR